MSTGLPVFDTTVQETNEWLKAVQAKLPPCSRQEAYGALRAVLHVLRDRLPMDAALGLSAQAPMLVRGFMLEGWRPGGGPSDIHDPQDFAASVAAALPRTFPRQPNEVAAAVFAALGEQLDPGEAAKLEAYLPRSFREAWPIAPRGD